MCRILLYKSNYKEIQWVNLWPYIVLAVWFHVDGAKDLLSSLHGQVVVEIEDRLLPVSVGRLGTWGPKEKGEVGESSQRRQTGVRGNIAKTKMAVAGKTHSWRSRSSCGSGWTRCWSRWPGRGRSRSSSPADRTARRKTGRLSSPCRCPPPVGFNI